MASGTVLLWLVSDHSNGLTENYIWFICIAIKHIWTGGIFMAFQNIIQHIMTISDEQKIYWQNSNFKNDNTARVVFILSMTYCDDWVRAAQVIIGSNEPFVLSRGRQVRTGAHDPTALGVVTQIAWPSFLKEPRVPSLSQYCLDTWHWNDIQSTYCHDKSRSSCWR